MVLAWEQRLSVKHFSKDAARAPDVDLDVILLPGEHDLGGAVISRGHISSHLGVLDPGQAEIADLEIAVLIDEDVAGLQVAMNNTGGMDVFQTALLLR